MKTDILFLSHGGGPMPLLGDPGHASLVQRLQQISSDIPRPDLILMISAHWEESVVTITSGAMPTLMYDYYGFPQQSYELKYPCSGSPDLAFDIQELLQQSNIESRMDAKRGFDHGVFVPLMLMYPEADIPVVQLSLLNSLNAGAHLNLGKALKGLKDAHRSSRLLVIGSGFSFHNMREFFLPSPTSNTRNRAFEQWLIQTCMRDDLTESERSERLNQWATAPHARYCHPREEHLLPLHICSGMAGVAASRHWKVNVLGKQSSIFYWPG